MENNKIEFKKRITDIWDYPKLSLYNNQIDSEYFDFLEDVPSNQEKGVRLYIHTPFCNSFCYFCQFYKEPHPKNSEKFEKYYKALKKELEYYAKTPYFENSVITSIYWGGGDPASIDIKYFIDINNYIKENFNLDPNVSVTLEGNIINLLNEKKLITYKENGISRFSFGIQTFDENLRKKLLIKPTISQIYELVELFKKLNITKYTFDLMYNLPDQTMDMLKKDLELAIQLNPEYIDFFNLNMYPNTAFYDAVYKKGNFEIVPDKEREHDMLKTINEFMDLQKYNHVLSVTYSKKEKKPHIGLFNYLKGADMLGVGPSARSFLNHNKGYRNICSVDKYIEIINEGNLPVETGCKLTKGEIDTRNMVISPTLLEIEKDNIHNLKAVKEKIQCLINSGYLSESDTSYKVTTEGKFWIGNIQKYFYDNNYSKAEFKNFLKAVKDNKSAYNQDLMWIKEKK